MEDLPKPKQIEREAFNGKEFKVDEFLYQYHNYQSLEDLQKQLRKWKQILEQELIDVINEDYKQFVELGQSLSGGESTVDNVKVQLSSFQRQVSSVQQSLEANRSDIGQLLDEKKRLVIMQGECKKLLIWNKQLKDIEQCIDKQDVEIELVGKKLVGLLRQREKIDHEFVNKQSSRVDHCKKEVVERLKDKKTLKCAVLTGMIVDIGR